MPFGPATNNPFDVRKIDEKKTWVKEVGLLTWMSLTNAKRDKI